MKYPYPYAIVNGANEIVCMSPSILSLQIAMKELRLSARTLTDAIVRPVFLNSNIHHTINTKH